MKRSLLVLISLWSSVSPSFAMLEDELVETYADQTRTRLLSKDLRTNYIRDPRSYDANYKGRSAINNFNNPKLPMVHSENSLGEASYFSAALAWANAPAFLKDLVAYQLPDHQPIYSFCIQTLKPNPARALSGEPVMSPDDPFALYPQYLAHPNAPYIYNGKNYETPIRWTVIPGVVGSIEPASGGLGLQSAMISTVHNGALDGKMSLAGDMLQLKGIEKIYLPECWGSRQHVLTGHQDCYSLVAFTNENGEKIVDITYRWLLSTREPDEIKDIFKDLEGAETFKQFIDKLESSCSFKNIVQKAKNKFAFDRQLMHSDEEVIDYWTTGGDGIYLEIDKTVAALYRSILALDPNNAEAFFTEKNHTDDLYDITPNIDLMYLLNNMLSELKKYAGMTLSEKLDLRSTGNVATIEKIPVMTITTDYNAHASYQAESHRFPTFPGEKIRIPYNISVEEGGRIAIGLLNTQRNEWYGNEVILGPGHHNDVLERIAPEGECEASLVVRNYHLDTPGQSIFTVNSIKLEREMNGNTVDLPLTPTANPVNLSHKNVTKIVTDNNANASYQMESERHEARPGEKIRIPYDIAVEQGGRIAIGLLNSQKNGWYGEEIILEGPKHHKSFFERIVPVGENEASLVVRNYHLGNAGQSTFTINSVKIEYDRMRF